MTDVTQEGRFLSVDTPLGPDVLLLESFAGREELSRPFELELTMLSAREEIPARDVVGKSIVVRIAGPDGSRRLFSGFVRRFAGGPVGDARMRSWRASLVPWIWFLGKRSGSRIFQDLTVTEIVERVFTDAGFTDFDTAGIRGSHPKRPYCVQYQETDLDFVSRLLEDEGIFYFFRFEADGRHVLVLADDTAAYQKCARASLSYTSGSAAGEHVSRWEHRFELVSGKWSWNDYDFKNSRGDLFCGVSTLVDLPGLAPFERYEYPGGYAAKADGEERVKLRMEAEEAGFELVEGDSNCPDLALGTTFTLDSIEFPSERKKSWVLVALEHRAREGSYAQSAGGASGYVNAFRCLPSKTVARPPRRTPRPRIAGPQTAVVVGPSGEEIHTDPDGFGCVRLRFHWDREDNGETSSCWVRVAQAWAGRKWGSFFLPRVGQEVVVAFLEGDPDRPLVVGSVHNDEHMPAYELPGERTQSGIKTRSSTKGSGEDFNELRFEDAKGSEHVFFQAQKDLHSRVKNDVHEHVGNDLHRTVAGDVKVSIEGSEHRLVAGDHLEQVDGERSTTVGGDRKVEVAGGDHLTVAGDRAVKIEGDDELKVSTGKLEAQMDLHRKAGMNVHEKAGMNWAAEGGMNVHLKGGMNVVVEAGLQLTLKAGAGFVTIGPAGVDISGPLVKINSGGAAGSGSGASPEAPGAPESPSAPEEPVLPMEAKAGATGDPASAEAREMEAAELEWTAVETAPATGQAAALEEAAQEGTPFCEECAAAAAAM